MTTDYSNSLLHQLDVARERIAHLESTNSKLAAEIAELKAELEHYGSVAEWMGKPTSDLHTELIRLRAELEAVNTRYSELAAKRAKTDQLYQLALNNQEDLGKRLEAARKEIDKRDASIDFLKREYADLVKIGQSNTQQRDTALAAKDAAERRVAEVLPVISDALNELSLTLANKDRRDFVECRGAAYQKAAKASDAIAALTPAPTQEPPAGGVTISNETVGIIPTATTPTEASPDVSTLGAEAASHPISTEKKGGDEPCAPPNQHVEGASLPANAKPQSSEDAQSTGASNSPADVPSEGRGEWMPIETAPKDGTKILIASICGVESGYWCDKRRPMGSWVAHNGSSPRSPHSWQPLPPPPMLPTEGSGATNEIGLRAEDLEGSV